MGVEYYGTTCCAMGMLHVSGPFISNDVDKRVKRFMDEATHHYGARTLMVIQRDDEGPLNDYLKSHNWKQIHTMPRRRNYHIIPLNMWILNEEMYRSSLMARPPASEVNMP
jgi:hypothetical protein